MHFGKLKIQGRPMFNGLTEFDFGHVGLTVVHGLNTSGGKGANNPNAAGKSALFATVQDLLYKEILVGSRRDRVTEGNVSLEFGKDKNKLYKLVSKNNKLSVLKPFSKESLAYREKSEIDDFVKTIVPPSLVAYATLCHIDDRVPHPLARGETDVRRKFFTKFFELDSTDYRRKLISSRLSDVKAASRLVEDKRSRLASLPSKIPDLKAMKAKVSELEDAKASMQSAIDEFNDNATLREFLIEHKDELSSVPNIEKLKSRLDADQELLDRIDNYSEYLAALSTWKKQCKDYDEFCKKHEVKEGEQAQIESCLASLSALNDKIQKSETLISDNKERISALRKPEEHSLNCETCGAELTGDLRKRHEKSIRKELENYEDIKDKLKSRRAELKSELQDLNEELKKLPTAKEMQTRLSLLAKMPTIGAKPRKPEEMVDVEDREELVKKIQKDRSLIEKYQWASGKLWRRAQSITDIDEFLARRDPTKKFLSLVEELSEATLNYSLAKKQERERSDLQSDIEELDEELRNVEALEILEKAYGPRGFRRVLINTICQQLESTLSRSSKILFPEDYSFELELDKQFHILVSRKFNDKILTSDVRRLSGAESAMFNILLWAGLMSFVPKALRPNFLVLDEVDARLGPEMTERFLSFLPRMLKVVEHVIVVTPKSETRYEDYVPNVRYLTVVKKGLSSTIAEGKSVDQ